MQLVIDIIVMVGGKSGFEIALNRTADYLSNHNCIIRFIQVIKTGYNWATDKASYICFDTDVTVNIAKCQNLYIDYLEKNGFPNVIFCAGMPATIYIAKKAQSFLQLNTCPIIAWPHNDIYFYDQSIDNTIDALNYADYIFAISDKIANDISSFLPSKIIYRINNTIDNNILFFSNTRSTNKLAYVGRLSEEKEIPVILKAISLCKTFYQLSIIGEGNELDKLNKLSDDFHITNKVFFYGWKDAPWHFIADHKALILASSTEGSPLTCIEALACGMPVISTPVATIPELITPGSNGYIYPFNDAQALADILDKIAAENIFTDETAIICRDSVSDYMSEVALWDFLCKTIASSRLVGLPQRYWQNKEKRIIKYKASVIIYDNFSNKYDISSLIKCLIKQTIESKCLEIIFVHNNSISDISSVITEFENKYPEMVIILKCNNISSKEEAYNIGKQYMTGNISLYLSPDKDQLLPNTIEDWYMEKLCSGQIQH